jgi:hypothetical protein
LFCEHELVLTIVTVILLNHARLLKVSSITKHSEVFTAIVHLLLMQSDQELRPCLGLKVELCRGSKDITPWIERQIIDAEECAIVIASKNTYIGGT